MAETLIGSEIIRLGNEISERIQKGEKIYNFTIGDFNPTIFSLPPELKKAIISAYENNETNYPVANGVLSLRKAVKAFLKRLQGIDYAEDEILIAGGSRPLIYATYRALVDPGDKVLFPVPSWNNNHYAHLSDAGQLFVETSADHNFMPTAAELKPLMKDASLLALCSPLNPTGTVFSKEGLAAICDLVIEENQRRGPGKKPLYILYDQMYWALTYGDVKHYDPVSLRPELRNHTIYIDGLSKAFAATGVRVGWAMGPRNIIDKMKSILGHVGAWSPKPEQVATAEFLANEKAVDRYLAEIREKLHDRLQAFYNGFAELKKKGYPVDAIAPQAAIYLTVKLALHGYTTPAGQTINNTRDISDLLLKDGKMALVPFSAFGASDNSAWFRLSVGTAKMEDIQGFFHSLESLLKGLKRVNSPR